MAGVRSSKTVGSTTYKFDTLSGKVMRQTWDGNVIDFIYDESSQPLAFKYNGATYYYVMNAMGSVIGLLDSTGSIVAKYTYDTWGKVTVKTASGTTSTSSTFIGNINPLRYRGYYYDTETGFYYLQTRYYDPVIGRFINADTYTTTDADGILSSNMFAYCENNPVNRSDPNGEDWQDVAKVGLSVAAIGLFTLSVVSTGGGALLLAGAGISASAATTAASATVAVGLATTGISILYAATDNGSSNQNREYSGGSKYSKDGSRIDYEYYGNGNGNVHFQNDKFGKHKIWELIDGQEKFFDLPKSVSKIIKTPKFQKFIESTINIIKSLAGI